MIPSVVVGRYRLDEPSRPDVDASTWKATDLTARKPVLACLCAGETGAAARSRRSTTHPGLVPVLDVVRLRDGVEPPLREPDRRGETFVILDPMDGEPLDAARAKRVFEAPEAVRMALALANALTAVHAKGSVHGSVCPAAIELRPLEDGGPRLGLRGIGDGALAYASPSRLCDGGPSLHDDAWGMLGVLYFLVTGSPPFSAETPQALARRVLGGRPIPIKMTGPPDAELQKIFDRGFSRTASQRFSDVTAVRDELRGWLARYGSSTLAEDPDDHPDTEPRLVNAASAPTLEMKQVKSARNRTVDWGDVPRPPTEPPPISKTKTMPFGSPDRDAPLSAPIPRHDPLPDLPPASGPATPVEIPAGRGAITEPSAPLATERPTPPTPSSAPRALYASMPLGSQPARAREVLPQPVPHETPRAIDPSSARPAAVPRREIPTDETARFTREQMEMLESEREDAAPLDVHVSESKTEAAAPASEPDPNDTTRPSAKMLSMAPRPDAAKAPKPSAAAPVPDNTPSSAKPLFLAFAVGVVVAVLAGGAFVFLRPQPKGALSTTTAERDRATAAPSASAPPSIRPRPIATILAPSAPTSVPATPSASASTAPVAGSSASSSPASAPPGDVGACVRASYADGTFPDDRDLSFVCEEPSARKATSRLHRAIVAGGAGRAVTDAMKEWAQLRWFEVPALATLRSRCCPAAKTELPTVSPACPGLPEAVSALSTAASTGGDLDEPLRTYRRLVSCLANTGDSSSFGQNGPMTGGEDTTFRGFVAHVRK